jgi:hypothetical protein
MVFHIKRRTQMKVFEKRAIRRITGPNGDEVTEERDRFYDEEFHIFLFIKYY